MTNFEQQTTRDTTPELAKDLLNQVKRGKTAVFMLYVELFRNYFNSFAVLDKDSKGRWGPYFLLLI